MRRRYTGGAIKLDTKDKANARRVPTQSHNLSFGNERILLSGMPGSGKTSTALQIICRSAPIAAVYVLSGTPGTREFDCLEHVALEEPPSPAEWAEISKKHGGKMISCIIDDWQTSDCTKKQASNIRMLLRTCSTHMNIQVILSCHSLTNCCPSWRRCMSVYLLWRPQDLASVPYLARQVGLSAGHLRSIFKMLRKRGRHSFLLIEDEGPKIGRPRLRIDAEHEVVLDGSSSDDE